MGIDSPDTVRMAKTIISQLKRQSTLNGAPIIDYYMISWHNYSHLLLGGIALYNAGVPERILPSAIWKYADYSLLVGYR